MQCKTTFIPENTLEVYRLSLTRSPWCADKVEWFPLSEGNLSPRHYSSQWRSIVTNMCEHVKSMLGNWHICEQLAANRHLLLVCLDQSPNDSKRSKSQILKWPETISKLVKGNEVEAKSIGWCARKPFNETQKNKTWVETWSLTQCGGRGRGREGCAPGEMQTCNRWNRQKFVNCED